MQRSVSRWLRGVAIAAVSVGILTRAAVEAAEPPSGKETAPKVLLRWKFTPGESIRYHYVRKGRRSSDSRGSTDYRSELTRTFVADALWSVDQVEPSGDAVVGVSVDRVRFRWVDGSTDGSDSSQWGEHHSQQKAEYDSRTDSWQGNPEVVKPEALRVMRRCSGRCACRRRSASTPEANTSRLRSLPNCDERWKRPPKPISPSR